jgi:hypothetical protein
VSFLSASVDPLPSLLDRLRHAINTSSTADHAWGELDSIVRRAATATARRSSTPTPDGGPWTNERVADLAQTFWATNRHLKVIAAANDDDHLRNLVSRETRNLAIACARKAGRTGLHDRLLDVLKKGPFRGSNGAWYLKEQTSDECYQGSFEAIIEAAYSIPIVLQHVRDDSQRRTSFATRAELENLVTSMIRAAGAGLEMRDLSRVVERRFNLAPPVEVEFVLAENVAASERSTSADADGRVPKIWTLLTRDQQAVLAHMDPEIDNVRATATKVGFGRDKVSRTIRTTHAILATELEALGHEERIEVLQQLLALAEGQRGQRTNERTNALRLGGDDDAPSK